MSIVFSRLPVPVHLLAQARFASSSSNIPFPFPKHSDPTPHEIFHLPPGASRSAIKSRYYELVRVYHPDCSAARALLPSTSHSRFQAISDAYATLLGKPSARVSSRTWNRDKPYEEELRRRRRAQWRASASSDEFGYEGYGAGATSWPNENKEKWDRGVLVFILVFALSSTILPLSMLSPFAMNVTERRHHDARKNLANARREAREMAEMRKTAMMKHKEEKSFNGGRQSTEDVTLVSETATIK